MTNIFNYEFARNALAAGFLASIACGIIGSIVVSKRIVSLCGGIAHASFGGVGLGYLLRINPSWGALLFAILTGLGIGTLTKKTKHPEDTSIALFWASGISLGILFISLAKGYVPDLFTYLFGNILTVSRTDIVSLIFLNGLVLLVVIFLYKEIVGLCFDEGFTQVRGIRVFPLYLLILLLASITVVVIMKIVGMILVIALLSIPAAISRKLTKTLKGMIITAIILNMLFIISGLILSYYWNLPSGATIILIATVIFILLGVRPRN